MLYYFEKAAELGNLEAIANLGGLYYEGYKNIIPKN